MRMPVRLLAVGLAMVISCWSVAVIAAVEPEGFDEFSAGEWFANARAGGSTLARGDGGRITGDGDFNVTLEFLVPLSGPTTGSWILSGSSVFTVEAEGVTGTINWTDHSAEGSVTGDRQRLSMGSTSIRSTGHFDLAGSGSYPISASDPFGPIELQVEGRLCDDAWGVWIMSWNSILEGEGYTPTFDGEWYAVRQSDEFSTGRFDEIAAEVFRVNDALSEALESSSTVDGVPIIPYDVAWGLVDEAVALINELRNLSLCDRALLGDRVDKYIYVLTSNVSKVIRAYLANLELAGDYLPGEGLLELATLAASVGAIGEGSVNGEAGALEQAFEDALDNAVSEAQSEDDLAAAYAAAEQLGWEFEE